MDADIQLAPVDPDAPGRPVGEVPFWAETHEALAADAPHRAWYVLHDGELVGLIGASDVGEGRAQVGYGVTPSHEGRGITSAALRALLTQLRQEGVTTVVADTFVDHGASRRILEKAGFTLVSTSVEDVDGEEREVVRYELQP